MDWLNLHVSILDSPEVLGAEPVERATWLMLLRYCIGQENGGRIREAASWGDRKWQQVVRVTKAEVTAEGELFTWDGDDIVVAFYPIEKEQEVRKNRENGKKGGRPKNPDKTQPKPDGSISPKRKGKEGEGKGREWNARSRADEDPFDPDQEPLPETKPAKIGKVELRMQCPALRIPKDEPELMDVILALANEDPERMRNAYVIAERSGDTVWASSLLAAWDARDQTPVEECGAFTWDDVMPNTPPEARQA